MSRGVFITGTDTGVGKTCFTVSLMETLKNQGYQVSGMKPVSCGAVFNSGKLVNEDAQLIMQHCSKPTDYELINPIVYESPVSPNIAANQAGQPQNINNIINNYNKLCSDSELVVVEGVGGWRVPLSDKLSLVDLVRALDIPVILVVGLKLGCINHAILSAEAIRTDGLNLIGWVSNRLDKEYLYQQETIETLNGYLTCPHIVDIPYLERFLADELAQTINISIDFLF